MEIKYLKNYKLGILAISLFKLWLVLALPIIATGHAGHDERLFLNWAAALLQGNWLGDYNNLTLAKGPVYSMWLALNSLTGLPLLFSQQLLYLLAGVLFIAVLRKTAAQPALLVSLYAVYALSAEIIPYVLRAGIYPALSVFIFASLAGLYNEREAPLARLAAWALFSGVALSLFWLTREEGLWIIPSILFILAFLLFSLYRSYRTATAFFIRTGIALSPFILLFGSIQLISFINKEYYDTYTVVELNSKPFTSAYGALSRVRHPSQKRYLDITSGTRQVIYRVSPAFQELAAFLDGKTRNKWINQFMCIGLPHTCGEIAAGWFAWALRDAVADAGYYHSGSTANAYYERLADEVNGACDQGVLDCLSERARLLPPYRHKYTPLVIRGFISEWKYLAGFTELPDLLREPLERLDEANQERFRRLFSDYASLFAPPYSSGTEESLVLFRELTHNHLAPLPPAEEILSDRNLPRAPEVYILQYIAKTYRIMVPPLLCLALALYFICLAACFFKQITFLFILNTAILGAVVARLLMLAIIDITWFPAVSPQYLAPLYPLLYIFIVLAVFDALQRVSFRSLRHRSSARKRK
ncbi:MAG: hypothetical protein GY862_09890 [Gammaproteobacteria bacterium]|nr:hypothetical protein [Gammaproteobacteria bacterium]